MFPTLPIYDSVFSKPSTIIQLLVTLVKTRLSNSSLANSIGPDIGNTFNISLNPVPTVDATRLEDTSPTASSSPYRFHSDLGTQSQWTSSNNSPNPTHILPSSLSLTDFQNKLFSFRLPTTLLPKTSQDTSSSTFSLNTESLPTSLPTMEQNFTPTSCDPSVHSLT